MTKALVVAALFLGSACSSSSTTDGGGTTTIYNLTGGGTGGTTTGGGNPVARVRVAALSPDAPAFDYCVAIHGTTNYIGPILTSRGAYGGLVYPAVADYGTLAPGSYDLHFVPPSSQDCGGSLSIPDATTLPEFAGDTSYTVAVMGPLASLTITTLTDDTTTTAAAGLRFINSSHAIASLDMSGDGTLLFSDATYATVPPAGGLIDANGYTALPTAGSFIFAFNVHGSSNTVLVTPVISLTTGSVTSVFGIPPPSGYSGSLAALVCFDSSQPVLGLTRCITF